MPVLVHKRFWCCVLPLAAVLVLTLFLSPALAYVEAPYSLGRVVAESTNVVLMRVEKVDKQNKVVFYRKVSDIKGKHPTDLIVHNMANAGIRPTEWKQVMDWAEVGKTAVFFHNGGASETCIGTWWYQCYGGGQNWGHSHGEPFLLRSYAGNVEKLAAAVTAIHAGQEVIVPCMVNGNLEDLHQRKAKIQRVKASLKLLDYNPKRDFVGWGGEDFLRLSGIAGFTHYAGLTRVDPDAQCISCADIDGDGKMDLCLIGAGKLVVLLNSGESLTEIPLPGAVGVKSAVWADYNGDGRPDLLLATVAGAKLYTNLGNNVFKDHSHLLPAEPYNTLTAAAWIDYDGDGKPDILLANGYHGLRLYRNISPIKAGKVPQPTPKDKWFEDVSNAVGLGANNVACKYKGDTLAICDVDGDGRPDFLYGAGTGMLFMNTPKGFVLREDSGIVYKPGKVGPVFGDFDNDGFPDLLVPQMGSLKLFQNDGKGRFKDVTAQAGDLAKFNGKATSAAWGDLHNSGHLDLVIGCLGSPNRFFRNKGNGTFDDVTPKLGLQQRTFNTQAVALIDINNDGMLDVVFNNEGQEPCILLTDPGIAGNRLPVMLTIAGKDGVVGSQIGVFNKEGKLLAKQQISGGDGRGGQASPLARFALDPGTYRVVVRFSSGVIRAQMITVAVGTPFRGKIDEQTPIME
jgi:hypothetical protein